MRYRCRADSLRTMEFVSGDCLDLTGYRPDELVGNQKVPYAQLIHPDDWESLRRELESAFREGGSFHHAYRLITAEGEEKWVWDQGEVAMSDQGEALGFEGVVVDIAGRVLAHETLERSVEDRTRELSTLLEVSRNVTSTLELNPLLAMILEQLGNVMDYSGASIFELQGDSLPVLAYRGPAPQQQMLDLRFQLPQARAHLEVIESRRPQIIPDIWGDSPLARAFQDSAGKDLTTIFGYVRCWMGVPLVARNRVIGMLSLYHGEPNYYEPHHARLALAFADNAAVAILNARLYSQAEQAAAVAERNRLARDLHDAVTQTLFSASLIAEVLPRLWRRDPEEGHRRLEELHHATRGALAEMRSMLLELRPAALGDVDLGDLLRQLAEGTTGRARIPVEYQVEGKSELPPHVQVALYRIAQEALNNVARHSQATRASVELHPLPDGVELRVTDNGRGFGSEARSPEHLGLSIMRERAEEIGARLTVESEPGHGCRVTVRWMDMEEVGGK